MLWKPEKLWDGSEVFIIGGGDSLRSFEFNLLTNEKTIGCNNAYQFGPTICNICIFGDKKWFDHHQPGLERYVKKGGFVITNDRKLESSKLPWLHYMPRKPKGLHLDALGWNANTGASAMNLALLMGAKKVYLLGFDRFVKKGRPNWHDHLIDKPNPDVYPRMNAPEGYCVRDLAKKFPGCTVINLTEHSELPHWPKQSVIEFFNERKRNGRVSETDGRIGGDTHIADTAADSGFEEVPGSVKIAG